jgi:hypothetical protein
MINHGIKDVTGGWHLLSEKPIQRHLAALAMSVEMKVLIVGLVGSTKTREFKLNLRSANLTGMISQR